jgi:hypothetical protein
MVKKEAKLQGITLTEFNKRRQGNASPSDSLFVLNMSKPVRGRVAFSVMGDMNNPTTVVVPRTFIPVDLTLQATLDALLSSPQFRRHLSVGFLVIVDEKDARAYMATSDRARAEYRTQFNADYADSDQFVVDHDEDADTRAILPDATNVGSEETGVSPLVASLIARSNAQEVDSTEVINSILNNLDSLSTEDLTAIANGTTNSDVKDFCIEHAE